MQRNARHLTGNGRYRIALRRPISINFYTIRQNLTNHDKITKIFRHPELWFLARSVSFRYAVGRKGVVRLIVKFNAAHLKSAREQKHISQMRLAELCDSSDRYIRALELGKRENPSAVLVWHLCHALELRMEDLMLKQEGEWNI